MRRSVSSSRATLSEVSRSASSPCPCRARIFPRTPIAS